MQNETPSVAGNADAKSGLPSRRRILRWAGAFAALSVGPFATSLLPAAESKTEKKTASKDEKKTDGDSQKPKAGSEKKGAQPEWQDLFDGKTLRGWKKADFGGSGEVTVDHGTIRLGMPDMMTGVVCTRELPKMDYEVTLEGKRVRGNDFFCTTTFPVGKSFCSFVVGGWGGGMVGLSNIDHMDASENITSKSREFKNDRWYKIRIRVTKDKIETWIDDEKLVDLTTKDHAVSTRMECTFCRPFGIATYATEGAVRNIRIRRVSKPDSPPKSDE